MTQVVILQPALLLPVNNTGRSHWLHCLGVPLDGVHHGQTVVLSLTVGHNLAPHGVQVLLLRVVVPPPLLLTLGAGGSSAASVR